MFTDFFLAIECFFLAWLITKQKKSNPKLTRLFMLFLASSGLSALIGGVVHGFFLDPLVGLGIILWKITIICLGFTALTGWFLGAELIFSQKNAKILQRFAILEFTTYFWVVILVDDRFWIAIANYAPVLVFLLFAFLFAYWRNPQKSLLLYSLAVFSLMPLAAILQQLKVAIHPTYFNHNATYHLVQAIAFYFFFLAAKDLINQKGSFHVQNI